MLSMVLVFGWGSLKLSMSMSVPVSASVFASAFAFASASTTMSGSASAFCNSVGVLSRPLLRLMYGEYWFRLSRLSMMVIGSFASYTKTKSAESAVWCLLTLDDGVETGNRQQVLDVLQDRNTWTEFRIRIVLFSFWTTTSKFNESETK